MDERHRRDSDRRKDRSRERDRRDRDRHDREKHHKDKDRTRDNEGDRERERDREHRASKGGSTSRRHGSRERSRERRGDENGVPRSRGRSRSRSKSRGRDGQGDERAKKRRRDDAGAAAAAAEADEAQRAVTAASALTPEEQEAEAKQRREEEQAALEAEMERRRKRVEEWRAKKAAEQAAAQAAASAAAGAAADAAANGEDEQGQGGGKGWSLEDDEDEEDPGGGGAAAADEPDPLDAFMATNDTAAAAAAPAPPSTRTGRADAMDVDADAAATPTAAAAAAAANGVPAAAAAAAAVGEEGEEEVDPLDAFMSAEVLPEVAKVMEADAVAAELAARAAASAAPTAAAAAAGPGDVAAVGGEDDGGDGAAAAAEAPAPAGPRGARAQGAGARAPAGGAGRRRRPRMYSDSDSDSDDSDSAGSAGDSEDDAEWIKAVTSGKLSKGDKLGSIDHSKVAYAPFRKAFYIEVAETARITDTEVRALRKELDGIKVRGQNIPKPIRTWTQAGLSSRVLETLRKGGFTTPLPIQAQALPIIMSGRDCIGIAKTGSGKTLAFVLPMLRHIKDQPPLRQGEGPIGLIMAPTRELVQQIAKEIKRFAKPLGLVAVAVFGGSGVANQISELKRGAEAVAATPGRFIDLLATGNGKITNLRRVTYLVLDEADRMFDMGFEPQIARIVANIRPDRQTVMFSATFPRSVETLARQVLVDPVEVQVGGRSVVNPDITQLVEIRPEGPERFLRLLELLGEWYEVGKILVFVHSQEQCDNLFRDLLKSGYPCLSLHGGKDQTDRECTLSDYKNGVANILVATSVAARGLDVKDLVLVVNYDVPNHHEDYVHRVGRTGRAGNKGTAVTFIAPEEERYAPDLVKALKDSGAPIPQDLTDMAESFQTKRKAGLVQGHGSGYGGSGFKFDSQEADKRKKERKAQAKEYGVEVGSESASDDDDIRPAGTNAAATEALAKSASVAAAAAAVSAASLPGPPPPPLLPMAIGVVSGVPAAPRIVPANGLPLPAATGAGVPGAAPPLGAAAPTPAPGVPPPQPPPGPPPPSAPRTVGALGATAVVAATAALPPPLVLGAPLGADFAVAATNPLIAAAQAAAARAAAAAGASMSAAAAMSVATARFAPPTVPPPMPPPGGPPPPVKPKGFEIEFEINDFPQHARWKVTHKGFQHDLTDLTGAAVTTRGIYVRPGAQPPEGERRLYLLIEGPTEQSVKGAKAEIKRVLEEATEKVMRRDGPAGASGRYSVV